MSLLQVENLKVHFSTQQGKIFRRRHRTVHAVNGVTFSIAAGETLGLVGESGCGKTTTGRAITKLVRSTQGSIIFEDRDVAPLRRRDLGDFRRRCQMVFQNPYSSLDPRMTIRQILEEPLLSLTDLNSKDRAERVSALMREVHLSRKFLNRYPHEFSGGQRQRINIARALSVYPKLIVADEPVSALDVSIQAQIINLLQDLQTKFKMAYLFIAHDLSVVKVLSQRVAVMYLGKIVEIAPTKILYASPMHPYSKALMSAVPIPDPVKERKRIRLIAEGEVPSPIDLPTGCTFHPRCPFAEQRCRVEVPLLRRLPNGSEAACHFAEKIESGL
jgi:oligopeptide/dipeptide ABC transporter ATP-binding protein